MEKTFAVINASFKDITSSKKKVVTTVVDKNTGKEMKSCGSISGFISSGNHDKWKINLCFKTAENDSQIKEVTIKNDGSYKINSMIRNRPIPSSYRLVSVDVIDRYTKEEERQIDLMNDIHEILNRRCSEYVHFSTPILLSLPSINKTVYVEYFTKDWFGSNDIINYRTDYIRMSTLSIDDLISVKNMLLSR